MYHGLLNFVPSFGLPLLGSEAVSVLLSFAIIFLGAFNLFDFNNMPSAFTFMYGLFL